MLRHLKAGVFAVLSAVCLGGVSGGPAWADTTSASSTQARVIVKLKANSTLLAKQIASADRTVSMAQRLGLPLEAGRAITSQIQVMKASGMTSEALAARLAQEADVEYAVPDRVRTIRSVTPNDSLFSSQWYLTGGSAAPYAATNTQAAWDFTTGSASVIVAVIDTGVRTDHTDLSAKFLPGYTFISDCKRDASQTNCNFTGSNLAPYAGASDPGDYVTSSDLHDPFFNGCSVASSSWHGTRVSGIMSASTNNSVGMAGVSWGSKILPVRVLGKCGGLDSDIMAGMRWAAGLAVSGATTNPNPAKVINLSLGGSGTCTAAYQEVIAELTAKGVLVVVAAGNENTSVGEPGNCPGVLTVAGVRHVGTKVGYSSFGPEVGIAAPAGNCVNTNGGPCLYAINTTTNSGINTPVSGTAGSTYTDSTNYSVGTSFSSPMVAGAAALMFSVNPALTPDRVITRIKAAAKAFPAVDTSLPTCTSAQDSTLGACSLPVCSVGRDANYMCYCDTNTCGAGLLDTNAAVTLALNPVAKIASVSGATAGSAVSLDGSGAAVATGHTLASYAWTLVDGGGIVTSIANADKSVASVVPAAAGSFIVSLRVTDDAGRTDTTQLTVSVSAASNGGNSGSGAGGTGGTGTTGGTSTTAASGGGGAIDGSALLGLLALLGMSYFARRGQTVR